MAQQINLDAIAEVRVLQPYGQNTVARAAVGQIASKSGISNYRGILLLRPAREPQRDELFPTG
jgi:hypothetical protein